LPEIPTVGEFVPGYEATGWQGIVAPKNTPTEIVDKLNEEIRAALSDPKMTARIVDLGATPFASSPAEFGKFIVEYTEKWGRVNSGGQYQGGVRVVPLRGDADHER
jgi:tripartite-type tricarboxylate transporter receptor subunit TctC